MNLHERINQLFIEQPEKNQSQLAKATGKTRAAVSIWRSGGIKSLDAETALKTAAFFGVTPEWLIMGTGQKYPNEVREEPPSYGGDLKPRQKIFIDLIEALPKSEQEELMRELEEKKLYWERMLNELKLRNTF